jgi:hypothetical protein
MIRIVCAALVAIACVGCAARTYVRTYEKKGASELQVLEDKQILRQTSGVANVILEQDRDGTARLQLFVEEGKELRAAERAAELGYTPVH